MSITLDQLPQFLNPVFIETGTYTGLTIQKALDVGFEEIHSIEISKAWYKKAKLAYAQHDRVHLHLGNSADVLSELLPSIQQPATVWLDAHNFEFFDYDIETAKREAQKINASFRFSVLSNTDNADQILVASL